MPPMLIYIQINKVNEEDMNSSKLLEIVNLDKLSFDEERQLRELSGKSNFNRYHYQQDIYQRHALDPFSSKQEYKDAISNIDNELLNEFGIKVEKDYFSSRYHFLVNEKNDL